MNRGDWLIVLITLVVGTLIAAGILYVLGGWVE